MNQGTKQIDSVTNNTVCKGYVKTKVGVFPVDWKQVKFGDLFSRLQGKNTNDCKNVLTISAQFGLINQGDFFNKDIASEDKSNYFLLKKGDWAYNKSYSSGYPFGAIKRLDKYEKGIVSPLYICFADSKLPRCSNFYSHYFENGLMDKGIKAIAQEGARNHGLLNIGVQDFFNLPIMYPPVEEQEKIAEILDAQDRIIQLKEKLLEEKKQQKKYLMQQLLTGKKRLPGFTEPWKKIKLGDVFKLREEKKDSQNLTICSVAINEGVIDQIQHLGKSMAAANTSNYSVVRFGDLVYTKSPTGNFPYGIIKQSQLHAPVAVSPLYGVYIPKSYEFGYMMNEYFSYYNNTNHFLLPIINKGAKNTISIADQTIFELTLTLPQDNDEIRCLAQLFKDLNIEIDLLQQSIEQEKQKKKALMQLLLTGIVRTFK